MTPSTPAGETDFTDDAREGGPAGDDRARRWGRWAALATAIQSVILVGFVIFFTVEIARGVAEDMAQVLSEMGVLVVFAAGLAWLARGLVRGAAWARTPVLLWNFLLLPVAWAVAQSDQYLIAGLIVLLALAGFIPALLMGGRSDEDVAA